MPADNLMCIDGEWQKSESGETYTATNPATGESLGEVPAGSRTDVQAAIGAARAEQPELADMTAFERADICREIASAVRADAESLARTLTKDQGKPIEEARGEVEQCALEFEHAADAVTMTGTEVLPAEDPNKRIYTVREPHGVYGVITPWNFPVNIPAEYLAAGLAGGNTLVWVPAPTTSVIAVALMETVSRTSVPSGAINLVTGEGSTVGNELVSNDGTDAIGFTGSPETGELIAREAGLKPTLLELGGNGPVIVLEDADVAAAADCAAAGCFGNAGQICTASERILVHEAVRDSFVEHLIERAEAVSLGDPLDPETDMGPLNNSDVATKMDEHVENAVEQGATLRVGGDRAADFPTDRYYRPTVLTDVTTDTLVNRAETFGPIAPVITFEEYDEAIRITNDIDLGLASSVFTTSLDLMDYFTERIETGLINVNDASTYWEVHTPFGGYVGKRSGNGKVGGKYGLEEMTQLKTVAVDHDTGEVSRD